MKRGVSPASRGSRSPSRGARAGKSPTTLAAKAHSKSPSPSRGGTTKIPVVKSRTPTLESRRGEREKEPELEVVTEETFREEPPATKGSQTGVRYINEDMIRRISKEENVANVTKLNLTLSKEGAKKIKYIENLERCKKLRTLNLGCNQIEKMEKLDKLVQLRELNISFNNISRIEGIESLVNLQILNVTGNKIARIPVFVGKKLKALRTFRIAKNNIETLNELSKLRPLTDLMQLTVSDNPVSSLPHCRSYCIFYLRSLEMVDGRSITADERTAAQDRFEQDEVQNLGRQLEEKDRKMSELEDNLMQVHQEKKETEERERGSKEKHKTDKQILDELRKEMQTKDSLLKKKTSELTKACEKHYELEQELAFYKIDHKFESLGKPPERSPGDDGEDEEGGLFGESPYLGRGRYKENKRAFEMSSGAKPKRAQMYSLGGAGIGGAGVKRGSGDKLYSPVSPVDRTDDGQEDDDTELSVTAEMERLETEKIRLLKLEEDMRDKEEMQQVLDNELEFKQRAIEQAEVRLGKLQNELQQTESQVLIATEEFNRIAQDLPIRELTEDDKDEIRHKMAKKMQMVNQLRDEVQDLEADMKQAEDNVRQQQISVDEMKEQMKDLDTSDARYSALKVQVADKEQQITFDNEQYSDMQRQLDNMLARIAKETSDIKRLEQQLRDGQAAQNDEMKAELEGIITGLQDYLWNVRKQADIQRESYNDMLREKESLVRKLQNLEGEMSMMETEAGDYKELQKRLAEMEETLQDQQDLNASLQQQLLESPNIYQETEKKLEAAEDEISELQHALQEERQKAQQERDELTRQLGDTAKRVRIVEQALNTADAKEDEVLNLSDQLAQLQDENQQLQKQLKETEVRNRRALDESIRPNEIGNKIQNLIDNLEEGKKPDFDEDQDEVDQSMSYLQDYIQAQLEHSRKEVQDAKSELSKSEAEIEKLKALKNTANALQAKPTEKPRQNAYTSTTLQQAQISPKSTDTIMTPAGNELRRMQNEINIIKDTLQSFMASTPKNSIRGISGKLYSDSDCRDTDPDTPVRSGGVFGNKNRKPRNSKVSPLKLSFPNESETDPDSERNRRELYESLSEDERALFKDVQSQLQVLQEQMKDADIIANQKLIDAQNHLMMMEEELQKREERMEEEKEARKMMEEAKMIQAAQEIEQAQNEIEYLQGLLQDKEQQIGEEIQRNEETNQTVAIQNEELDYVQQLLEGQKGEIDRLHDLLEKMSADKKAGKEHQKDLERVKKEVAQIRQALTQSPQIQGMVPGYAGLPPVTSVPAMFMPASGGVVAPGYSPPQAYPSTPPPVQQTMMPNEQALIQTGQHPMQQATAVGRVYTAPYQGSPSGWQTHPVMPHQPPPPPPPQPNTGTYQGGGISGYHPPSPIMGQSVYPSYIHTPGVYTAPPCILSQTESTPAAPGPRTVQIDDDNMITEDETLFCNVPEHHELEDYIVVLKEKLKEARKKLRQNQQLFAESEDKGHKAIQNLMDRLETKREEMEALDLAIERQKQSLRAMKDSERKVELEKDEAVKVLNELKKENEKRIRRKDFLDGKGNLEMEADDYQYDYDPASLQSRHTYLVDEISCLEETLARRRAELREADRLLLECESDLQDARQQEKTADGPSTTQNTDAKDDIDKDISVDIVAMARDTVKKFDLARSGYDQTKRELEELERRAHSAGINLVRSNEELKELQTDIKELQSIRDDLDATVHDINQVISTKDDEFKILDSKVKDSAKRLTRMQQEYEETEAKEREKSDLIKSSDLLISEKRAELDRLRMTIESERAEMEQVDKEMGRLKTELQIIRDTFEEKQADLRSLDREVEKEIANRQRDIKETRALIEDLNSQKRHLSTAMQTERDELSLVKTEIEREEQTLHMLTSAIGKHKAELKHVLEMFQLEQTELNQISEQHKQKMVALEKVQITLQEEKAELDAIQDDRKKKQTELDRLRVITEGERRSVDQLEAEKRSLETNISVLSKEKEMLDENCKNLETKINTMKRDQMQLEDAIHNAKSRLNKLETELTHLQTDVEGIKTERVSLQEDVSSLTQHVNDGKVELRSLRESIKVAEDHITQLEQEMKSKSREKETLMSEVYRLDQEISQRKLIVEDWSRQEKMHHDEVDQSKRELETLSRDCGEARKLVNTATMELDNIKKDLVIRQDELADASVKVKELRHEAEQRQHTRERIKELDKIVKEQEKELGTSNMEKQQLAQALNHSYKELQALREEYNKEKDVMQGQIDHLEEEVEDLRNQLQDTLKELKHLRKKSSAEIADLEQIAQDHCARANRLSDELNAVRQEFLGLKQQMLTQAELQVRDKRLEESVKDIKSDIQLHELNTSLTELEKSRCDAIDELSELQDQKQQLQRHLEGLKENLATVRGHSPVEDYSFSSSYAGGVGSKDTSWKKDSMKDKFIQEQDYLKSQLRQQMSRHAEALMNERQRSDGTLQNLKRRLNNLQDVLSNSDLTRARSLQARSPLTEINDDPLALQDLNTSPQGSPGKQRSYAQSRQERIRNRSWDKIPERGPQSPTSSF
ncbi:uncharacterized protein LOC141908208 isoform X2 [Tubulanus polymorphus]|uniref:uncharacterized protein LOC141908208 isoform X2 n=1 Tax=Tubulanus polymorphus TaxID=672921 RepID=UPI003DA533FA